MTLFVPDCAGSISLPAWALHLTTVRSASLSYARKLLVEEFAADPEKVFFLENGAWHVDASIASQFPKEIVITEETGCITIRGWEPGGDLTNLRERLKMHAIPYDAEKLARGRGENLYDEKNYLRFDHLQRATVKTVLNNNQSSAPTYPGLRDLAAAGKPAEIVGLIDAYLSTIGPPTALDADAPGPQGLVARLLACYIHAGNAAAATALLAEHASDLTQITLHERLRILSSAANLFGQGNPDGIGTRLLELCLSHGMKSDAGDLAEVTKNVTQSAEFLQQYRIALAHQAVTTVLHPRDRKMMKEQIVQPRAWMHFPAWALWNDDVRFELDRMLGQKPELPLRVPGCPLWIEGRAFNLDTTDATWNTDPAGIDSVSAESATRFAIEGARVILEGSDPAALAWNKLQGILSVYRVPMNHLKEGTERHYRYERRDIEQIHHPLRDHQERCTKLEDYCHEGSIGAYFLLELDASRGRNFQPLLEAMPGVLEQLTNEQKYAILAEGLRNTSKSTNSIMIMADAGMTMPPNAVDWLQQHYAHKIKPANYEEHLKLIGALQARQGLQAIITKARGATP